MAKPSAQTVENAEAVAVLLRKEFDGRITPSRPDLLAVTAHIARELNVYADIEYIKRHAESIIVHFIETGRRPSNLK